MPVFLRWIFNLGPTNPIAVRLVQNGSRRSRHHYVRIAYLGALIIVLLWALLVNAGGDNLTYQALASAGSKSFEYIAYLQIGLICILAPVFMAGAIAAEADPRTWDILLTTPLKAGQIVLGNLFGRLFFIIALLLSSLPLFAITQYFGGVPGSTIFASYSIAACAALLVGSLAIALSVSRLVGKRAVFAFYVGVVTYLAITIAIDSIAGSGGVTYMTSINPFLALTALLDPTGYPRAPEGSTTGIARWFLEKPVTTWCLLASGISIILLMLSTLTVRLGGIAGAGGLIGRDGSVNRKGSAPLTDPHARRDGQNETHRGPKTVWNNPISWREAASRNSTAGRVIMRWSFVGVGIAWALFILWFYHSNNWTPAVYQQVMLATVLGELVIITLVAMNTAATSVSKEREDGTLDLLLTTPLTPGQYLSGKLQGMIAWLLPMLAVPILTVSFGGLYALAKGFGRADNAEVAVLGRGAAGFAGGGGGAAPMISVPSVLPEAGIILALVALPFLAFCVIIGMNWSLRSKGTLSSVTVTVGIIAAIAGTAGLCAWNAGESIPLIGPVVAALSPISSAHAVIYPGVGLRETLLQNGLTEARISLFIGAVATAGIHIAIVYGVHAAMTKNFDFTVRKLAGTK